MNHITGTRRCNGYDIRTVQELLGHKEAQGATYIEAINCYLAGVDLLLLVRLKFSKKCVAPVFTSWLDDLPPLHRLSTNGAAHSSNRRGGKTSRASYFTSASGYSVAADVSIRSPRPRRGGKNATSGRQLTSSWNYMRGLKLVLSLLLKESDSDQDPPDRPHQHTILHRGISGC
jgi:hypothetical protein